VSVEMMGLLGAGNNPMVGMTVAVAVAIEEAMKFALWQLKFILRMIEIR